MNQSDNQLSKVVNNVLDTHTSNIGFESVWSTYAKRRKILGMKRVVAIPVMAVLTFLMLFTVGFASYTIFRNVDKIDYPFVEDKRVVGRWDSVDFVKNIEDFDPQKKSCKEELFLKSLVFITEGKMLSALDNNILAPSSMTWTKDMVLDQNEKTASKYEIKEIKGTEYMFYQWKSGDYIFRNMTPYYYVLKRTDSNDYSNFTVSRVKEDKVDYPFVDDEKMKGKWESFDIVSNAEDFKPGVRSWQGDISILEFNIEDNGIMTVKTTTPESSSKFVSTWTKGMVLFKKEKVACKCEVKEMDGDTYMFYEWKNGDYVYRGMEPFTLVLKKVK